MQVVVLGLWHLGCVTAACLARHHQVTGLDFEEPTLTGLRAGRAPLHEPGLDALLAAGLAARSLSFSSHTLIARDAEIVWVCFDTPVDADDRSDLAWVHARLDRVLPTLRPGTVILVSSQLPVGTCAELAAQHPQLLFACSPENLRLGKAIDAFEKPARIVVGTNSSVAKEKIEALLLPLNAPLLWVGLASAEMVKHALNSFLALSVAYINEIATIGETVGADAQEVADGLKSDPRIGPRAYLGPGGPFAGGTLARDVVTLTQLGRKNRLPIALIPAIKQSNDHHRGWAFRRLEAELRTIRRPVVAVFGLAYTTNTSTLRRSSAVELCRRMAIAGWTVKAFDPLIRSTDLDHQDLSLTATATASVAGADALVICTEWPEFRDYSWSRLLASMARPLVVDANRFLEKSLADIAGLNYVTVGRPCN